MKPASTFVLFALLLCAIVLFVSAGRDSPKGDTAGYGEELAKGRCIHGCCSRSLIIRTCKVCCASAEEAKAAAAADQLMKDGMGGRGGATAEEAKAEANP